MLDFALQVIKSGMFWDYIVVAFLWIVHKPIFSMVPIYQRELPADTSDISLSYEMNPLFPGWTLPIICYCVPLAFSCLVIFWAHHRDRRSAIFTAALAATEHDYDSSTESELLTTSTNNVKSFLQSSTEQGESCKLVLECLDMGLALALAVNLARYLTALIGSFVGRLRPDFLDRLRLAEIDASSELPPFQFNDIIGVGRRSFPSGHSFYSFATLGLASFYCFYRLQVFTPKGNVRYFLVCMLPIFFATIVAFSRVADHRHHVTDVVFGSLMGLVVAAVCFWYAIRKRCV